MWDKNWLQLVNLTRFGCIKNTTYVKGILGLGGLASKNTLKDTIFIFPMTIVTILGVFRTHAHKEYGSVLKTKSTYIAYILALLFFKIAMPLLKVWSKRHPL